MKNIKYTLAFLLFAGISATAQKKISQEEIWNGTFRTQGMTSLNAMKNSNAYTVLDYNRGNKSFVIDLYDFATLERTKNILDTKNFPELTEISEYSFNNDETKLLIATNSNPIYRHSFTSLFYSYDTKTNQLVKVSDREIQEPQFNYDGSKIAYVYDNNIFVNDLNLNQTIQITDDGVKNNIINGITDWVYEEEFAFVRAYEWNADGTKIAYIKFDETEVPEFSMDVYGDGLYPTQQVFKYPKAGEKNALVSLHIYDLKTKKTSKVDLGKYTDFYIPRIKWTNDANILSAQVLNRHQNNLDLLFIDGNSANFKIVLNEKDKAYVDITDNLTFLDDNSFIWTSEKDGFNHIYHYDKNGKLKNQITKGNWDVTNYYGFDNKNSKIFYQSVENGSTKRDVYSIDLNGKNKKRLSQNNGTNNATFSPNFDLFINNYSSSKTAPTYTLNNAKDGKEIKTIVSNKALEDKLKAYNLPEKEFFEIKNASGDNLNAWIIKPKDFDPNKKYPLLMYQYSGPGSQQVADEWKDSNEYWHALLTQEGYIVLAVDGRGTGYKGADFKKVTQNNLGKYEVEDQIFVAKEMAKKNYIDADRIGIWGWSFGGFMSSNALFQAPEVFKTAIAVAPVTSWRFYDTVYTERFLSTPQENPKGYDENSPISYAQNLKGNYLLIHGTADDNVHVQNAMVLTNVLVHNNKKFDWAIYPDKNHGIYGGKTREQLYTKMTDYIKENL
ncbi:S9 family peptidase [Paenimyroides tangerinum]|uniref:S9 family peptidase n=1 Tax=Paenimyroides tangerinum TaxID=2488728 RepID=A0A3P3WB29_9FLAO|nr:S9 family peptidase [Paenimyroides tangerinum]RRJ91598.1 S9 family peptidase [Paenimyroides tangerinum]